MLERSIRYLALALGATALGISVVYWIAQIRNAAPRSMPLAIIAQQSASDPTADAAPLFGDSSSVASDSMLTLTGVLSLGKAHNAAAIVDIGNDAPVVVAQGKDILPGTVLKAVKADSIIVTHNGVDREIFVTSRDAATPPSIYVR